MFFPAWLTYMKYFPLKLTSLHLSEIFFFNVPVPVMSAYIKLHICMLFVHILK